MTGRKDQMISSSCHLQTTLYFSLQKLVARFFINWLVQENSWVIEKEGVAQIHMGCAQVVK